jgi:Transcriptional regulators
MNLDERSVSMTIRDIAGKAGVSTSTVSRVLNNSGYVGAKTRKQVMRVIEENDYKPSAMARGLSRRESNAIGVVVPQLDNDFFGKILTGVGEVVDASDLTMILCNTDNSVAKEFRSLSTLREQRVRGLLITPEVDYGSIIERRNLQSLLDGLGVPVVMVDRRLVNPQWDGVYFDNYNGAFLATEALIDGGNRRIGAIISDIKLDLGAKRYEGFVSAMQLRGLTPSADHLKLHDFVLSTDDSYRITKAMIDNNDLPEALFLGNGLVARGFFKAILEAGLRLQHDICCIGFDHIDFLDIVNLNYSYVERNAQNMGRIAMQMLLERSEQPILARREHIIPAELILNGSEKRIGK